MTSSIVPSTTSSRKRKGPDPGKAPAPTRPVLHEAALAYLARGAASASSVERTLERRIANWARRAQRAGRDAEEVASLAAGSRELVTSILERLTEVGLVNDTAYAETRAKRMSESGRSRRAISAHLSQKGVAQATVREAVAVGADAELAAAITFARKRRLGPFARDADPDATRDERRAAERKQLGTLARAGFDFGVCERVLRMDRETAEALVQGRREF